MFSHKWGLKPDGTHTRFDEIVDEIPLTSGAYTIAVADSGRRIEFKLDPNYWARDLPVRRGFFNFGRVVYRYYQDEAVATEAFKAGEFDLVRVYGARRLGAPAQGPEVGRRAHRQAGLPDRHRPGPAVLPAEPAPAAVPGHPRARGTRR